MPKIDLSLFEPSNATGYPSLHARAVEQRWHRRFARPAGLELLGANHVVLKPGAWSSQRHWHEQAEELVIILAGEAVLVEDGGETPMRAGDIAVFPSGVRDGHHFQNRGPVDCAMLAVSAGHGPGDSGFYPDIDMKFGPAGFTRKDGTPFAD